MMHRITFTYCNYVVAVIFNNSKNADEAIESARLYVSNKYTNVRAECVEYTSC